MSNESRGNPQEIPTEENHTQTERVIQEQNRIPGEERSENVKNFPETAAVGQLLKDLDFPADKQKIIQYATDHRNASSDSEQAILVLQKIRDRSYNNVYEAAEAAGLV